MLLIAAVVGAAVFAAALSVGNEYFFFAGYVVLQYIVLATAWNILGGYSGYVNFGTAAFFALGAYTTVAIHKFSPMPIPVLIVVGGVVSGLVGLGMGYLTLRLRGVFFAIATLALAVVLQTLVVNWDFVGGSRGAYIIRPARDRADRQLRPLLCSSSCWCSRSSRWRSRGMIERSRLGYGFATIRDDELAAEASGVPTLRLKLIATTISGALMGMAGAPFPYYIGYLEPASSFNLAYAVNSIAMPMIGGTTSWIGPLIGAILLGTIQQVATVTISSARQPADRRRAAGRLRHRRAERHRRPGAELLRRAGTRRPTDAMTALLEVAGLGKRFGGFVALEGITSTSPRRAARPHRAERLGQEHAGQLPLRHAAQRDRHACVSTAARSTASPRTSARGSAWRAASSCRGRSAA